MATDQWMLESVAADPAMAMLRTYEWSEPTLSLGYFQHWAEAEADPRWRGAAVVRRSTGGGAIWHDRELTYAVVVPASHPMAKRAKDLYRSVHERIRELLAERGVAARRRGAAEARVGRDRPLLCFVDRDAEDLVIGGTKVLGSAQRRRAGALLQHGSLLLARSGRLPEVAGLAELAAPGASAAATGPEPAAWSGAVRDRIAAALGLEPIERGRSEAERQEVSRIAETVYRDAGWTARR